MTPGRFKKQLKQKQRALSSAEAELSRAYEEGRRNGLTGDELQNFASPHWAAVNMAREEYMVVRSLDLYNSARDFEVPVPPRVEGRLWERGRESGEWFLTDEGAAHVRGLIRAERSEKHELMFRWVTLLIGLIGVATGFIAVLLSSL